MQRDKNKNKKKVENEINENRLDDINFLKIDFFFFSKK